MSTIPTESQEKPTLEELVEKNPIAVSRLNKVAHFPIKEPVKIVSSSSEWGIERQNVRNTSRIVPSV